MTINSFEIPRDKWGTGQLLNYDGTMCCLGHLGFACGLEDSDLANRAFPDRRWAEVGYPQSFLDFPLDFPHDGAMTLASDINDNMRLSRPEKERQIKVLFASRGIKVKFTGTYPAGRRKV